MFVSEKVEMVNRIVMKGNWLYIFFSLFNV